MHILNSPYLHELLPNIVDLYGTRFDVYIKIYKNKNIISVLLVLHIHLFSYIFIAH